MSNNNLKMKKADWSALQKRAEDKLNAQKNKSGQMISVGAKYKSELHRTELEMQNDELLATQRKLQNSIESYTELFNRAPVAYMVLDGNGIILNVNNRGALLVGVDKKQLIGKHFFIFLNGESFQDDFYRYRNLLVETAKPSQIESDIKKKDGSIRPVLIEGAVVNDENGEFKQLLLTITAISSLKNVEDELRKEKLLLQAIYNNTSTLIINKDLDGRYLMVNQQFQKVHNLTVDELIGKTAYDIMPAELADIITANDQRTINNKRLTEQEVIIMHRADGSMHTYLSVSFPLIDDYDNVYSICNISSDITEKKKFENELIEANAKMEAMLENSISSVWSVDKRCKLTKYNNRCIETFKKIHDFSIYAGISMLKHLRSEEYHRWKGFYGRALGGERFSEDIIEIIGDQEHYFEVSFNPILLQEKVIGVSVFSRDITMSKKMELQLLYKVSELNTFMYKATHDLRSPLTSVLGLVRLAKEVTVEPELKKYFDMIDKSTERMDRLLIDLFNIANITQEEQTIDVIDFEPMIDEILDSLCNRPDFEEVVFRKKIVKDTQPFRSCYSLVYSMLQNIIDNAIKYQRKSVLVDSIIVITISIMDNAARICVTDNGIGIPEQFQEKVFDMFYRATTESTGTGLGLYIVKNTVDKLGGEIRLKSEVNHGTSVFITLPNKN